MVILFVRVSSSACKSARFGVGAVGVFGCWVDSIVSNFQIREKF